MGYSDFKQNSWHSTNADETVHNLNSAKTGLSPEEVAARTAHFGPNLISRNGGNGWLTVLWRQINNPLIWVLIGSCTLAVGVGKLTDGLVVLAVVVINTLIGFIQEFKAGKAIEALKDMVPQNATVIRAGKTVTLAVSELVPGDIVFLTAGDRVPADMRLLSLKNLQIDEAALTGESLPVQKSVDPVGAAALLADRICMVYSGTLVTAGTATAIVTGTGGDTELGRISQMIDSATDLETPLTQKLEVIGKYLTIGIVALTAIVMVIGVYRALGQGIELVAALKDTLIFAIALAVGAIPEGLPAVVTIALAIGVQRMAARHAIIRKLPAVETLGSTTVICSDKTGTLTRNEMTVTELWTPVHYAKVTGSGYNAEGTVSVDGSSQLPDAISQLLRNATLCNDASMHSTATGHEVTGDPTEIALLVAAAKVGIICADANEQAPRKDVLPFDSDNKYMATLNGKADMQLIIKGAPEIVLGKCSTMAGGSAIDKEAVLAAMEGMAKKGMRVLAIADKQRGQADGAHIQEQDLVSGFELAGLVGMIDPPRTEAIEAIKACHNAGIVVKMITGDHPVTAHAIGTELGISKDMPAISGAQLSLMDDQQIGEAAKSSNIFARVAPEHKLRLVKALQAQNHIVAMTGDGVNDAPSLKQSNIGVAMGITGTSVSKESSDIILADDNFSSISAAVEEGRRVYDNLLKSLAFLIPTNLGLAFILIWGIMFFPFDTITNTLLLPMLPAQLLWINLVAAVTLALPLAFESKEPDIMSRPPRRPEEPLFNTFVIFRVVFVSILMTAGTIIVFLWQRTHLLEAGIGEDIAVAKAQTMAVTFVIIFQIFYMLNCRSLHDSITKIGIFSNRMVFVGVGTVVVLHAAFIYMPAMHVLFKSTALTGTELLIATVAGFAIFPIVAIEKFIVNRFISKK